MLGGVAVLDLGGRVFESFKKQGLDFLRNAGATEEQLRVAEKEINRRVQEQPDPKVALIGFTGVGKSSTINALFNAGQEISDVRACTQEAYAVRGEVNEYIGSQGRVIVYDMPGLGEDLHADQRHLRTYEAVLPRVDVAVWTFHAGDRAMTPMQQALLTLQDRIGPQFSEKLMFAVNKADAIAPGEKAWVESMKVPSREQQVNIVEFEQYILEKVRQVLPRWNGHIVTYSARQKYRLEPLMTAMVETVGVQRRWILEQRADVADYLDGMNPAVVEFIRSQGENLGERGSRPWRQERS